MRLLAVFFLIVCVYSSNSFSDESGDKFLEEIAEKLANEAEKKPTGPPLGNLKSEEHRKLLCKAWDDSDWTKFSSYLTKWSYQVKDIYYDLKCTFGAEQNIPLLHAATHDPTTYKVIYQRLMRQMHKEGGNHITTCAITNLRYRNTTLLFDELEYSLLFTQRVLSETQDPEMLANKNRYIKDFAKMKHKLETHVANYPVKTSDCPHFHER